VHIIRTFSYCKKRFLFFNTKFSRLGTIELWALLCFEEIFMQNYEGEKLDKFHNIFKFKIITY